MRKTKHTVAVVLAAMLCFVMASCLKIPSKTTSGPAETYVSTNKKYSVQASGWSDLSGRLNKVSILEAGSLVKEQYLALIPDSKTDLAMNFDESTTRVVENLVKNLEQGKQEHTEPLTINGMPATCTSITGAVNKINAQYWLYTVECSDDYMQILTWTLSSKADTNKPVLRKVALSFQDLAPSSAAA